MIYEETMKADLEDFGRQGRMEEHAILKMLENISSYHSDYAGLGANSMEETKIAWILLEWKVEVLQTMHYGYNYRVKTWSRGMASPCTTLRDFEIFDEQGELMAKASSKWTMVHTDTRRLFRMSDEVLSKLGTETKEVFPGDELIRLHEPASYEGGISYQIRRSEIDLNGHVHNLYYLDFALEALPEDVYATRDFHSIRISYRNEIKASEGEISCKYHEENGVYTVGIYGNDGKIRAIVELS